MTPRPLTCSCCGKQLGLTFSDTAINTTICWQCLKAFGDWVGRNGLVTDDAADPHLFKEWLTIGLGTSGTTKLWLASPDGEGFRGYSTIPLDI